MKFKYNERKNVMNEARNAARHSNLNGVIEAENKLKELGGILTPYKLYKIGKMKEEVSMQNFLSADLARYHCWEAIMKGTEGKKEETKEAVRKSAYYLLTSGLSDNEKWTIREKLGQVQNGDAKLLVENAGSLLGEKVEKKQYISGLEELFKTITDGVMVQVNSHTFGIAPLEDEEMFGNKGIRLSRYLMGLQGQMKRQFYSIDHIVNVLEFRRDNEEKGKAYFLTRDYDGKVVLRDFASPVERMRAGLALAYITSKLKEGKNE